MSEETPPTGPAPDSRALSATLLVAWGAVALAAFGFFVAWNPPLQWLLLRLAPLGVAALWLAAAYGFGALIRRDDPLVAVAYGLGVLAAIVLGSGIVHWLDGRWFAAVLAVGLMLIVRSPPDLSPARGALWLVPFAVVMLPLVAAPETSSDALYYHLLVPKLWLRANAIANLPLFVESHYPPLAALHYTALLSLHGDVAAKGLHFLMALLVAGAVVRIAPKRGVLAAVLFLSMPVAALVGAWAWNDMFFTFFLLMALGELRDERLIAAGALFGLAAATKYTFVLAGAGIVALFIRERRPLRQWFQFALPLLAISLVWMTKNVLETHNPIYPFLVRSGEWTDAAAAHFHLMLRSELGDWPLATYLQWPVLMTMHPRDLDIHTGLLPLLLLPLAFLAPRDRRKAFFGTYVAVTFAFWLVVKTVTRSLLVSFALLFVLIAAGFDTLSLKTRRVVATVIALALLLNLGLFLVSAYADMDPVRYFVGLEQREAYVSRTAPLQRVYFWLDHNPDVQGVLLVARHDPFYLDKPVLFSSRADTPYVQSLVERYGTADRVAQRLREQGITHIVVDTARYSRENVEHIFTWNDQARAQFRELLRSHARAVAKIDDAVIFRLEPH